MTTATLDQPIALAKPKKKVQPVHVHIYRRVPKSERTDRMKFVCGMFKCECGDWYWL